MRTVEHRNTWDADDPARAAETKKGFLDFIGIGKPPQAPAQTADEIAAGWDEGSDGYSGYEGGYRADSRYSEDRYDEGYAGRYDSTSGDRDDLDSGWENFETYSDAPPANAQKRVYRDGLYDDSPYVDPENLDDIDAEGVYEADYRVIEPPSKSLDELDDSRDDYPT